MVEIQERMEPVEIGDDTTHLYVTIHEEGHHQVTCESREGVPLVSKCGEQAVRYSIPKSELILLNRIRVVTDRFVVSRWMAI